MGSDDRDLYKKFVVDNTAQLYGNQFASFPVKLVRFNTDEAVNEVTREAEDWEDWFYKLVLFSDTGQTEALSAIPTYRYNFFDWDETDYLNYENDEVMAK